MNRPLAKFSLAFFLFLSFHFISSGQQPLKNYADRWKKVDDFISKELPKSALTEVRNIYSLAKKDRQDVQVIKSLVYMVRLQDENRESNNDSSIREIERELKTSQEPATSILSSMLGDLYWKYFQEVRYQVYSRTETANFKKDDISTWSADDFHRKIGDLYLRSIKDERLLQQTKLEPLDAIVSKGNVRHLRPTLYDLLANRALDYFENDERDIKKPAYAFQVDQASAFDPAADFLTRKFITKDSLSLQHKALLVFQKLIAFHINDSRPAALIDVDIHRLEFVNNVSVHPDKEKLYLNALNHIAHQYESTPAASQAWFLLANYYEEKAATFKPYGDSSHRLDRLKAKEICEKVLTQKDSSEGKINCYNLLKQIKRRDLQFQIEKVNVPNLPFRALISYRNFDRLYLRLLKADDKLKNDLENRYEDKYWSTIASTKPLKNWEQSLPVAGDMQEHSTEIKIEELPVGQYLLVASTDKDFSGKSTILGAKLFYVSNISYINNNRDYFILNRNTGLPLSNSAVQVWDRVYDSKTSKYIKQKQKLYTTNANGYFRMDAPPKYNANYYYFLEISYKDDKLFMDDPDYDYYYSNQGNDDTTPKTNVVFFTDRSIYRPGQTVYFKGIAFLKNLIEKKAQIAKDYQTMVYLRNANYQDIDSIKLKTNEYGSFSGKFQLPAGGLNGSFSIYSKPSLEAAGFRVEEYKRPKFTVSYEPLKGTYKVNDKIKITGIAKAYAGNNIDGAQVSYRVVRQPRSLYSWVYRKSWQPPTDEMEITHGETKTDKDGKFFVEFTAIPDLKIDKSFDPVFDYTVYADITDINGETRSGQAMVSVSYKGLRLNVIIPPTLPADSMKTLLITTSNMNGEYVPAILNVTFTKLREEKRLIRKRYWERPDQFIMSKEEYIRNFPFDEYDNENEMESWPKAEKAYEHKDSSKANSNFELTGSKFQPGIYLVEITTKDKEGEIVKDFRYIELYDENSTHLLRSQYLWSQTPHPIEPGEKTSIGLGTSADDVFIIQQVDKTKGDIGSRQPDPGSFSFLKLNNEKKSFDFSATEADRGGYGVNYAFVKHNRFYFSSQSIFVPWTNMELKVEYATYRDKTLPGAEERWKLKLTGFKKDQVAAEMMASMYDASLDQFYPHRWYLPSIWPIYYARSNWHVDNENFLALESIQKPIPDTLKYVYKVYDELTEVGRPLFRRIGRGGSWRDVGYYLNGKVSGLQVRAQRSGFYSNFQHDLNPDARYKGEDDKAVYNFATVGYSTPSVALDPNKNLDENVVVETIERAGQRADEVQIRKNFNETAFFFPDLRTDSTGAIEFSFTLPEALTRWKFQALAHTKDLAFGYSSKEIVTQKQLMVQPNAPRFLREGDKIEFSAKVVNLTDKEITGQAAFQLFDATTNESIDGRFRNTIPNQYFTVAPGQSEVLKFPIEIPYQFDRALTWRIVARTDSLSDGEEDALPVLSNRMLVTETLPLNMQNTGTKQFKFEKLLNSGNSETLQHYSLTVEYTSNPAWYAVQALPYLMEYPYECAEQVWNRYFANSLAAMIANSSPRIKQIFEQWKTIDTSALLSNLQKNQELKSVLLEETPWVLQAKTEAQQKKNIGLLFDMVKMSGQLTSAYEKLKQMQLDNGGFVWFKGGPDDWYITQYVVSSIGHLRKLKAIADGQDKKLTTILSKAIPYLDKKIAEEYNTLVKSKANLKLYVPGSMIIQYLYARSFFPDYKISASTQTAYNYFRARAQQTWTQQSKYSWGMLVLALGRTGDARTPSAILKSLKETSITNEELGMYWKDPYRGWWWYEAPIERQALLIEAFQEIGKDTKTVDDLKTWLLKNKQTNSWESTKATAEACYALLIQGSAWISNDASVQIELGGAGGRKVEITSKDAGAEQGTGYFKKSIEGKDIFPEMGNIAVTYANPVNAPTNQPSNSLSWGSVYWQYFEDLDKITTASTPLKLVKKLFVEKNTDRGPVLTPVNDGDALKVGDKIKVRIELKVDRDMEYVHMKDMRASATEPVNVLSDYKWQDGLGYYETTKDASTNFFFSSLRKGTYVFEYPLFVTHTGNFSNGVTTIQCMYAPEFTAHSDGIRINVEP